TEKVYLAAGSTDMRRSIDGLAAIVQQCFSLDPFSSSLFVFCNKNRTMIKILHWDHNGFWLYFRRLEKGSFKWPQDKSRDTILVGCRELYWLLTGLSIEQKQAHRKVPLNAVI
ncbi:MAG: IS66 family insertion sequence element accessory protein TnpB, partial [Clostridiaceae bacterium]|nr:IS66 family insertion sequence element accessory protein TnpB [Clostridiaceae bacterium]